MGNLNLMFRSLRLRILLCLILSVATIAGGFLVVPGIRHRHDDGDVAHSHFAHGHSHSHSHRHCHSHSRASHTHQSEHDDTQKGDVVAEEPSSHIHISLFGFELTLPDFLSDEPAPLVDHDSDSQKETAPKGDVIRLPSPFSLAQLIHVTLRWTAIECSGVQREGTDHPFELTFVASDGNRGLDPSAPLLLPPQAL